MNGILKTGGAMCVLALAISATSHPANAATEEEAHQWRDSMAQNLPSDKGCFHATYPGTWEKVACATPRPGVHPRHPKPADDETEDVGNTKDFVAFAKGLIWGAHGTLSTSGMQSEHSVGMPAGDFQGILGPNEYSLQINTNAKMTTSACAGSTTFDCKVWQQFVYATDYTTSYDCLAQGGGFTCAGVYIQFWLLDYGECPDGWNQESPGSNNCWLNSEVVAAPDVPIAGLDQVALFGYVYAGGNDYALFAWGPKDVWAASAPDSILYMSTVWDKTEFNILGDGADSRADFNLGTSITATLDLFDWTQSAPTCLLPSAGAGTTGETNNLNAGSCKAGVNQSDAPFIQFTESN